MKFSLLAKLLIAGCAVALVFLVQAAPETPSGQRPAQGQQRGPAQSLPPCFRTEVPAHPFDIILGRPTDHSGTASVLSYADGEAYVEWGTGQGSYSDRTETARLSTGEPREIVLQPLSPDTRYSYRLSYRNGTGEFAASDEYRFHTQR
ncbi:MAG: fibronectin type III domain-containing protein [Armatimonadia bacterium]